MNRDVISFKRQVYTSFMLFGDVGGLLGFLLSVCGAILCITNYQKSDNILVSNLFKTKAQALRRLQNITAEEQTQ